MHSRGHQHAIRWIEHLDPSRLTHDQTAPARDHVEGAPEGARYGAFATERRHMGT